MRILRQYQANGLTAPFSAKHMIITVSRERAMSRVVGIPCKMPACFAGSSTRNSCSISDSTHSPISTRICVRLNIRASRKPVLSGLILDEKVGDPHRMYRRFPFIVDHKDDLWGLYSFRHRRRGEIRRSFRRSLTSRVHTISSRERESEQEDFILVAKKVSQIVSCQTRTPTPCRP